jgi:hypothetical protein
MLELRRGLTLCHEVGVLNWLTQMVVMQASAEGDAGYVEDGLTRIREVLADAQPIKQRWLDAEQRRVTRLISAASGCSKPAAQGVVITARRRKMPAHVAATRFRREARSSQGLSWPIWSYVSGGASLLAD